MAVGERTEREVEPVVGHGRFLDTVAGGSTIGVGSLPHRNAAAAVDLAFDGFDVPTIPSLPRRSPAEAPVAQALVGTPGVALGQYGTLAIDVGRLDPDADVRTDLWRDTFVGFRTFLDSAVQRGHTGPIKWQFIGPISVGVALRRAGADASVAFPMAARVVRSHLATLAAAVEDALPASPQLVVLDEPFLDGLMARDFPIAPEEAIDLLSSSMAIIEHRATVGLHSCAVVDLATMMSSGPKVLSLPATTAVVPMAGYLARFLRDGGWIVWGAIATEGPMGSSPTRCAARLEALWGELAGRGCDPERLRAQSLISPQCGLGGHCTSVAEHVCMTLAAVAAAVVPR